MMRPPGMGMQMQPGAPYLGGGQMGGMYGSNSYNASVPCEIAGFVPISYDIPPPKRMRERFDFYQNMVKEGDYILIDTPDLWEFANDMDKVRNKDEFQEKIKKMALRRGLKISIPYGMKQGTYYV